jgi:hypothetical protein
VGINQGGFLGQPLVGIEGVGGFCILGAVDHHQEKASQAVMTWETLFVKTSVWITIF